MNAVTETALSFISKDIMNMLLIAGSNGTAAQKEETMRFGAEAILHKMESSGMAPKLESEDREVFINLVKETIRAASGAVSE